MSLFPEGIEKAKQGGFAFPKPLAEKYRPQVIQSFIGLDKQRKVLHAFCQRPVSCAWLFVGASGTGKSSMALAMNAEMSEELHHIPSQKANVQNLDDVVRQCWYAPMTPGGFHFVLCDEINRCSSAFQLGLFSKLDSTDPCPNTVWVFTANDTEGLEKAFLSRCRILEFSTYGLRTPLAEFLAKVWKEETGVDGTLNWEQIAKENNNNVRAALGTLEIELLAA